MHLWRLDFDDYYFEERRVYRDRINPLAELGDVEFFERYRFPKSIVYELCEEYRSILERKTQRSQSLSVELQMCIALRYFSHGGFLPQVADIHGVSNRSASRSIHDVSQAITRNRKKYIVWPSEEDMLRNVINFYNYSGLPKTIGAVDGCHIPIKKPSLPFNECTFVNRKGFVSINCHVVCDFDLKIIDFSPRWPGSTHDSFMMQQSNCWNEQESMSNCWILGDSAYPLLTWLLKPFDAPNSTAQNEYNKSHKKARSVIERCHGVLKSRFRCLTIGMNFSPAKCSNIIMACACLHNLAIECNVNVLEELDYSNDVDTSAFHDSTGITQNGYNVRQKVVEEVFSTN